jgi:hypothetical protein
MTTYSPNSVEQRFSEASVVRSNTYKHRGLTLAASKVLPYLPHNTLRVCATAHREPGYVR